MIRKIRDNIAYYLVEASFRISNNTNDGYFDDNLNLKPNTPLWIKFKMWIGWQLYHKGRRFYS